MKTITKGICSLIGVGLLGILASTMVSVAGRNPQPMPYDVVTYQRFQGSDKYTAVTVDTYDASGIKVSTKTSDLPKPFSEKEIREGRKMAAANERIAFN